MAAEMKKKLDDLEKKIHILISSHQELKAINAVLSDEKRKTEKLLEQERERVKRTDESYKQLREVDRSKNKEKIKSVKLKIHNLVGEIDKSVALMNVKK